MRNMLIAVVLAALGSVGFLIPAANADIYSWTDENGVRHFTNQKPPAHATLLMKTPEIKHDEGAHQRRVEEDRLAAARRALFEREAVFREQQQEAARKIAAANARADAALREADQILQDAEAEAEYSDYNNGYYYGYYYPYDSYYRYGSGYRHSSYYRHNLGLYRKDYYKHRRDKVSHHKKHGRHSAKYGHHKSHGRHSGKYGHNKKHGRHWDQYRHGGSHRSKKSVYSRHHRSHSVRSHYSLTRGRYTSHHSRSAAFRGRHGRF